MNSQDVYYALGLAVLGWCFALPFIDAWLERRRYREWRKTMTDEQWPDPDCDAGM